MINNPTIDEKNVRIALNSMLYATSATNPLESLMIVNYFLSHPDFPSDHFSTAYALQSLLIEIITEEFDRHRLLTGRSPLPTDASVDVILDEITRDGQTMNRELIGWSWLYHYYVRVDLGMTANLFDQLITGDPRTLRRYKKRAIQQLTRRLLQEERQIRKQQKRNRLYNTLQVQTAFRFFGRENLINQVQTLLNEPYPHHFQVNGGKGIGKSAFVRECLRRRIDADQLQQLIWIDRPPSIAKLHHQVNNLPSAAWTYGYPAVVVIDQLDGLVGQIDTVKLLLRGLANVSVFLIHRDFLPLDSVSIHLQLNELPKPEAMMLIDNHLSRCLQDSGLTLADERESIWQQVGGHPQKIRQTVYELWQSIRGDRFNM